MEAAFYVGVDTGRTDEVTVGLRWLMDRLESGAEGLIVAPTMSQFESSYLVDAIGDAVAQALRRNRVIAGPGGSRIRAETGQTFRRSSWRGGPVLVLWPSERLLDQLSDDTRVTELCAVPWLFDELEDWIAGHQATDLTGQGDAPAAPTITDPVVEKAMQSLTSRVNLSTGLGHPLDHDAAVGAFRALRRAGHRWTGDEIQAWAVAHGWTDRHARQLRGIAERIAAGRTVRSRGRGWREDIVAVWEAEVEGREPPAMR
jgi:hypothetical protein